MSKNAVGEIIKKYENLYGSTQMTHSEMWDAVKEWQETKDEDILLRLVGANVKLMIKEIIRITRTVETVDEYIGSAVAGFMDGLNKLDIDKATQAGLTTPNTYIFEWVRAYVRIDHSKDKAFLSGISGGTKQVYNKILQLIHSADMTKEEIIDSVATQLNEPLHIVGSVYNSIGARVNPEHTGPHGDLTDLPDLAYASKSSTNIDLMEVMPIIQELLTEKELYILMSRMQEKTLDDLGRELHVSKEAIRLQEKKALGKLRKDSRLKEFHDAL